MTDAPRSPLRIVLAEDSVLLREGLVRLFDEAGFETVASYGDADSLLSGIDETTPDVAVLDVRMPPTFRDEGVRAAIELRRRMPGLGVLLLSQYVEGTYAHELLSSGEGGMGHLLKDRVASLDELEDAVHRVADGGTVLDPQVVRELLSRRSDPLASLTPREREVMALMAEGRTNAGIAKQLYIGVGAVEILRQAIDSMMTSTTFVRLGVALVSGFAPSTGTGERRSKQ